MKGAIMFGRGKNEENLFQGALRGDVSAIRDVLQKKATLLAVTAGKAHCRQHGELVDGDTILHVTARGGFGEATRFLLSLKAHVNAVNREGEAPLHAAAGGGHHDVVGLLLEANASPGIADGAGRTAMHLAARAGSPEAQQLLVDRGAAVDDVDNEGNTPLHEAARAGSEPLVRLLTGAGAGINATNGHARTPLHMAMLGADHSAEVLANRKQDHGREATAELVKLLLSLGADANAVDARGETPLDVLTYLEGDSNSDPVIAVLRAGGGRWERYGHRHAEAKASEPSPMEATAARTAMGATVNGRLRDRRGAAEDTDVAAIELGSQSITIGRSQECDVRYRSLTMSRRHAKIDPHDGRYVLTDLGSHNGTLVDGERISRPAVLEPGCTITMGAYSFEFDGNHLQPEHGELPTEQLKRERQKA